MKTLKNAVKTSPALSFSVVKLGNHFHGYTYLLLFSVLLNISANLTNVHNTMQIPHWYWWARCIIIENIP